MGLGLRGLAKPSERSSKLEEPVDSTISDEEQDTGPTGPVEVITRSGSIYRVAQDGEGQWWMNADNVANPTSRRLDPDRWWRIQQPCPWPPELGERLWLVPPDALDRDDPERVPGGGKRTSPVRLVRDAERATR